VVEDRPPGAERDRRGGEKQQRREDQQEGSRDEDVEEAQDWVDRARLAVTGKGEEVLQLSLDVRGQSERVSW
jgi:hypothetical protein